MRATVCQLRDDPDGLAEDWGGLIDHCGESGTDLVVLPEMPFHPWLHAAKQPDPAAWDAAVAAHDAWIERLGELGAPLVLGTRPVTFEGRRRNEAFVWSRERGYRPAHHKRYLPDESGFYEASWYGAGEGEFVPAPAGALAAGFLICTEMWFTNHAREYASAGAELLASPRATESTSFGKWLAAGRVAAVMAGAFGLSSNRAGEGPGFTWGGAAWIIGPDGDILGVTDDERPALTVEIDPAAADDAKSTYPRYVR